MPDFEFLIPRRPVSLQTKKRENLQAWKDYVRAEVAKKWPSSAPLDQSELQLTLVYLCNEAPLDTDNLIKPIQDAMEGVVFLNDICVTDIDVHRRFVDDLFELERCPALLFDSIASESECVYVRVRYANRLEDYL